MKGLISWESLVICLAIFLFIYYTLILLIFFGGPLFSRLKKTGLGNVVSQPVENTTSSDNLTGKQAQSRGSADRKENVLYTQVIEFMEDLKPVIQSAGRDKLDASQIIEAIRIRLQRYPNIKGSTFQEAVSTHIERRLQLETGLLLSQKDIESLW